MDESENQITQILNTLASSRNEATERLLPVVYDQLRILAAGKLNNESPGHTLQATALVHEAYVKLLSSIEDSWENRAHFFSAAAEAMRRILVDHARTKKRAKRGGTNRPVSIDGIDLASPEKAEELLELDLALQKLETVDRTKSELVKLRFFAGLTMQQAAEAMGISLRTAERHWTFARVWLQDEIGQAAEERY